MIFDPTTLKTLEWVAAGLGLINIALLIFRSQWNFAFAIASVSLYVFIFFESRLYAESGLQLFFIVTCVIGWLPNDTVADSDAPSVANINTRASAVSSGSKSLV